MKTFITEFKAIDPETNQLVYWAGPKIESISLGMAQQYCNKNGLGYLAVIGEFIVEIPYDYKLNPNELLIKINKDPKYLDPQLN